MKTRIKLEDTVQDLFLKMGGGNQDALSVLVRLFKEGPAIDPDAAFGGGLHSIFDMDAMGIWEADIWMLYKDVCKESLPKMIGVLRANQLGFVSNEVIHHAIANYGEGIDVEALCHKVKERLPRFQLDEKAIQS